MTRYPYDPDYEPKEDRVPLIYTLALVFYGWVAGVITVITIKGLFL